MSSRIQDWHLQKERMDDQPKQNRLHRNQEKQPPTAQGNRRKAKASEQEEQPTIECSESVENPVKRDRRGHEDHQKSIRQLNRTVFEVPLKGGKRNGSQPYDGGRGNPCLGSYPHPGSSRGGTVGCLHNYPTTYSEKMSFL
jgi:hypothetical protein